MKKLLPIFAFLFVSYLSFAQSSGYYRVINKQTGKFLSFTDNEFSACDIVAKCGGGTKLALNSNITYNGIYNGDNSHCGETMPARTAAFIHVGKFLAKDVSLLESSDGTYNPGTIIYIKKQSGTSFDLQAQDLKLTEITNQGTTTSLVNITIPVHYATLTLVSGSTYTYTASMTLKVNVGSSSSTVGTKFFIDNNGKFAIDDNGTSSNNGQWDIIPVNEANLSSNYLAVKTISTNEQYGKYYTTLRTAFPFTVPSSSTLKVYNVSAVPSTNGGVASLTQLTGIIPAGLPVIIESESLEDIYNKLLPSTTAGSSSTTTALYNNYGVNDNELDYSYYAAGGTYQPTNLNAGSGDKIGYLNVKKYAGSTTLYKFGINSEGRVGFWDAVPANTIINGNEAYSTVQCALLPAPTDIPSLKDLPNDTETGYHIVSPLTVAYKDVVNNVIYAKDENGASAQAANEGVIDFMDRHYGAGSHADHSNWVAVKVATMPQVFPNDKIEVTGKVVDVTNRTIQGRAIKVNGANDFNPNTYCIANFFGQQQEVGGKQYFFATPQPNEVCQIVWALWNEDGYFQVPPFTIQGENINFSGGLYYNFNYYEEDVPSMNNGDVYKFLGLVRKETANGSTLKANGISNQYVIYPLSEMEWTGNPADSNPPTAISSITGSKEVKGVKYYNTMGIASDIPFKGVNIVVTTYSDGTRTTTKILH